jgi:hypothetical protein
MAHASTSEQSRCEHAHSPHYAADERFIQQKDFARIHKMHLAYDGRRRDRLALGSGEYGRPAEGVGASN